MDIYQTLGMFYVIFATGLATAGLMICCATGAVVIYRTYRDGKEQNDLERIARS